MGVKASKNGGVDACFKKTEGKPWEAGAPDASCVAAGEKSSGATGVNGIPACETKGGACGSDVELITRVLLVLVELEVLFCPRKYALISARKVSRESESIVFNTETKKE